MGGRLACAPVHSQTASIARAGLFPITGMPELYRTCAIAPVGTNCIIGGKDGGKNGVCAQGGSCVTASTPANPTKQPTKKPTKASSNVVSTKAPTKSPTKMPTKTNPPTKVPTKFVGTVTRVSAREWEHFELLNELRAVGYTCPKGARYPPNPIAMKFDCRLWKAAQLHSQDMANQAYFDHTSLDGRSPWDRAAAQGIQANGENIAAGASSAADVLVQWQGSDGHCNNMMKDAW